MQTYDLTLKCPECSRGLIDADEELVCPTCGIVSGKEVVEDGRPRVPVAIDFTGQALGGYLGPVGSRISDRSAKKLSSGGSSFGYLKLVSDFGGREEGPVYTCAKMIERVIERLHLPNVVMVQAVAIAKKTLAAGVKGKRITLGAVSAFSIVAACKIASVSSVSVPEVLSAHTEMGKRVTFSSLVQLSFSSPVKTSARRPEDYISRVLAKLAMDADLGRSLEKDGVNKNAYLASLGQTARDIIGSVGETAMAGRRPCALAATALYAADLFQAKRDGRKRWLTQRQVASCGDTAEYTVREQYQGVFLASGPLVSSGVRMSLPKPP